MNIDRAVLLKDFTWFKTGGVARYFCEPQTQQHMSEAVRFASEQKLPIFMLGEGANILISDDGFDGLVIRPQISQMEVLERNHDFGLIRAGAGARFPQLISFCLDNGLSGLEEFSGIPGTVGGSVFINIHFFEYLLSAFLVSATVVEKATGIIIEVDNAWFNFGYNYSTLHENKHYLVDATFKLKAVDAVTAAYAKGRRDEMIRYRGWRYPKAMTCGSFFRNFTKAEVEQANNGKNLIFIAYYLDQLGLKGTLRVGDAQVSHQHANMIVNLGNATSSDIIELARIMQESVYQRFNLMPQPECRLIGFREYPLMALTPLVHEVSNHRIQAQE